MGNEVYDAAEGELVPRDATLRDLVDLCRKLNTSGVRYIVVGGFAIRAAGLTRDTADIDLLIDLDHDNQRRTLEVLATLPDGCAREVQPGEVEEYLVVRVADEILVDLMASASGIGYGEAVQEVAWRELDGVQIPFASPRLLWRMKSRTRREKDRGDLVFLREYFRAVGEEPPAV